MEEAAGGYMAMEGASYDTDDPMIPCELCGALLPVDVILQHQVNNILLFPLDM